MPPRSASDPPSPDPTIALKRAAEFIKANTRLLAPPLVPEILLYLAEESLPIWRKTEEELGEMNIPPPYWAFAWAGGQALARYILEHRDLAAGKRVIDLGAGSGIAGIAAACAGASHVLAADVDQFSSSAVRLNAEANGLVVEPTDRDLLATAPPDTDLLLIADMFYEKTLAERVLAFAEAAASAGAVVLVGDPQRSYFPTDRFERVASYSVPVTRELEDAEIKKTAVWRLRQS